MAGMADEALRWRAIDALARQVVADDAPAELPLFAATADRFRSDPDGTLSAAPAKDETLGFGLETAVVLVTPFVLELVKRIFTRVADQLGDQAADGIAGRIARIFRRDGGDAADESGPAPLTPEQLALIGAAAVDEAARLRLPPEKAQALANGVIAALATRG